MSGEFARAADKMKVFMAELDASERRQWSDYSKAPWQGVYVLYENGEPTYVGRSNKMRDRIRRHGADSSDRHGATFAFKLLKRSLGESALTDPEIEQRHGQEFRKRRETVRGMTFQAVAIEDQLEQTLFEVYAILEKRTYPHHNDFKTH
ncbi:MAG: hypothetical protein OXE43_14130 [Chloroflexi bacterium]|nr:hypothetical protein [Chloroflexota bacterium]